ncbi:uncharacterized protein BDV14DRAFT_169226 [Aspergillus stella-maris]|uniref:uncharacterized protein n=1 Tax=Aspergillus stella-maris TaxID=1810926 RepID=UPI003CCCA8D3
MPRRSTRFRPLQPLLHHDGSGLPTNMSVCSLCCAHCIAASALLFLVARHVHTDYRVQTWTSEPTTDRAVLQTHHQHANQPTTSRLSQILVQQGCMLLYPSFHKQSSDHSYNSRYNTPVDRVRNRPSVRE